MKLVFLLTGLAVLYSVAAHAAVLTNPILDSAMVNLRAGARKPSGDFGKDKVPATGMRGGKKSNKKKLSKYGSLSSKRKNTELTQYSGRSKAKKGPGLRDKLEKIAKQGQSIYKDVYRRAKVLQSSAFEAMLLKATWPSNDPVQPEILGEIVKYSIPAFKFASAESEDDPYYMTLHKLWTKMSEKDWRTVTKSLYILHTIERDCQVADCQKFGAAIKDMAKTRNPKNPEHRYFEVGKIAELDDAGAEYEPFVRAYSTYVITRAKTYSARFEELKSADEKNGSEKKVVAALKKAHQLINLGLQTEVRDKKLANAISGHATKQVALDLRDLLNEYASKVALFLSGGKYASSQPANDAAIAEALKNYLESREKVGSFLSRSAKLFVRLRIKIPTDLECTKLGALSTGAITSRIAELTKLSGGSTSGVAGRVTNTKRVLHRAERPLTPQEALWAVELQGLSAVSQQRGSSLSSGLTRTAEVLSSGLLQESLHRNGGASELGDDDADSDVGDADAGEEDEAEGEDEELDEECGTCDDAACVDPACDEDMEETETAAETDQSRSTKRSLDFDGTEGDEEEGEVEDDALTAAQDDDKDAQDDTDDADEDNDEAYEIARDGEDGEEADAPADTDEEEGAEAEADADEEEEDITGEEEQDEDAGEGDEGGEDEPEGDDVTEEAEEAEDEEEERQDAEEDEEEDE